MLSIKSENNKNDVLAWQEFLKQQGYKIYPDGVFGEDTEKATMLFQAKYGLRDDGKVGDMTLGEAEKLGFATKLIEKVVVTPTDGEVQFFGDRADKIDVKNAAALAKVAPTLQRRGKLFIDAAFKDGMRVQIVQGFRTFQEQDALYAQGRTKSGKKVTNARGGQSMHNYGLALDFAPVVNGQVSWDEKLYKRFGEFADAAGLEWGGRWKFTDLPHVQDDEGMSLANIQGVYRAQGLHALWAEIK